MLVALIALSSCLVCLSVGQEVTFYRGIGTEGSSRLENKVNNDRVVLGGLFPVHEDNDCGKIFELGIQTLEAMVLATQNINDDSSLLPGVTLQFEIRDTCAFENKALEQSLQYVCAGSSGTQADSVNGTFSGVSGVVGAALSRSSIAVARLLRLFQVPQISYASTASTLSDKATFDYFFRTIPPDLLQAQALVDIIEHFNWTYVITIHTGDVYGTEGIRAFKDELEKRNSTKKCIATSTSIELQSGAMAADFDRAIENINQEWVRNATVVVLFVQLETAVGVLEAVSRKQKTDPEFSKKNFTWIGSDGWGDQIPDRLHEVAHGSLSIVPKSQTSDKFDNYFLSLHPLNYSANPWFTEYWESVFNCTLRNQSELEDCEIAAQTLSRKSGYRQNSFVPFTIDAVYAFAHAIHRLQQDICRGGRGLCQEMMDVRGDSAIIRGDLLLQYLHNVSFSPGVSSEVIDFDIFGDQMGGYNVKNLKQSSNNEFFFEVVGNWDQHAQLDIFGEVQWSYGLGYDKTPRSTCSDPCNNGEYREPIADQAECCWVCRSCPGTNSVSTGIACMECERGHTPSESKTECTLIVPSHLTWFHGWSIVTIILTSLGIIATSAVAIIFVVYYKHQLIKASSRELIVVLLIGIMLSYLLPFFYIAKPSIWVCTVRRFGTGFCFALCYSALLVKTNRIHRIFNRPPDSIQSPPLVSPLSQLIFTFLLVAVQMVVAIIWLVVERPSAIHVYNPSSVELICGESPIAGVFVALGYNAILLFITIYFAFRTRKVPQNFNEAKFINLTVYSLCVLWLAFIPFYFGSAILGAVYQTGSLMLAIILNATVTLCTLFVPKIYFLFSRIRKGDSSFSGSVITSHRTACSQDQQKSLSVSVRFPPSGDASKFSINTPVSAPHDVDNSKDSTEPPDSPSTI